MTNEAVATTRDAKARKETKEKIAEVADLIRAQEFSPKPGFGCGFCDYKPLCPAHEQLISIRPRRRGESEGRRGVAGLTLFIVQGKPALQINGASDNGRPVFISGLGFAVKRNPGCSAHELLWNFLPAIQRRRKCKRAQIASSIYKGATNEVKKKNFSADTIYKTWRAAGNARCETFRNLMQTALVITLASAHVEIGASNADFDAVIILGAIGILRLKRKRVLIASLFCDRGV